MNLSAVSKALGHAVKSQLQPKMLALLAVPFVLSLLVWAGVAWFVWDPLVASLGNYLFGSGSLGKLNQWIASWGLPAPKSWFPQFATFMLILPLMFVSAVIVMSVLAMPFVIRHLEKSNYSQVQRRGVLAVFNSLGNSLKSLIIFVVGYICTIPLWLIPPLILVVPWLWWGWLNSRILRLDSLLEHATKQERKHLIKANKNDYRLLGLAVGALNYIPPLFIVAPVFGALAFGHYSLDSLQRHRQSQ